MSMMNNRKKAIAEIAGTLPLDAGVDYTKEPLSQIFGRLVFSERLMQERLPKSVFKAYRQTLRERKPLDVATADVIANAMRDWAMELGATHFTHWFQPMTGKTAEKHDSFITPTPDGHIVS